MLFQLLSVTIAIRRLEKRFRAPILMALDAVFFGQGFGHFPGMRLMAILALHVHVKMDLVFADLRHSRMAPEAVFVVWLHFARSMRFMALIAVELHGRFIVKSYLFSFFNGSRARCKESDVHGGVFSHLGPHALIVAVAKEAFFPSRFEVLGPVSMTVEAGKTAHSLTMHGFSRMALLTEFLRRQKVVEAALVSLHIPMTLGAFDLLHVHMLGMEQRFIDLPSLASGCMALTAVFLRNNDLSLMALRHAGWTLQHKTDQKLVLFGNRQVMAIMAVKLLMFALRPAVIGRLHQVATDAELGIVLSKVVKFVRNETAAPNDDQQQKDDQKLGL